MKDLATSINIPVISQLNKGDAIWVKNRTANSSVLFKNNITNTNVSQDPADYDTSVLKIGAYGRIVPNTQTLWKAIYIKEANLWVENKTAFTGNQQYTHSDAVNYCSNLTLAGKDDWYLPSISELSGLKGIINIDSTILQNLQAKYWTKDVHIYKEDYTYYTYNLSDDTSDLGYTGSYHTICFRKVK